LLPTSQTHWGKWGSEMTKFPPIFGGYHLPIVGWNKPAFCYSNSPWWVDSLSWSPKYVSCKPCKSCLDFCCSIPKTITGWWYTYPSEKYESLEIMTFPTEWKVIFYIHIPNHQPAINIPLPEGQSPLNHH
jgi:hypothetical protein